MDVTTGMRRVRLVIGLLSCLFVGVALLIGDLENEILPLPVALVLVLVPLGLANVVSLEGERRRWDRATDVELAIDSVAAVVMVQLGAGVTPVVLIPPILILVVFEAAARRHELGGAIVGLVLGAGVSALRVLEIPPEAVPPRFGWSNVLTMVLLLPVGGWILGSTFASRDRVAADLRRVNEVLAERTDELARVNDDLGLSNRQLADVNHELELFAAMVAHDLKSPLGSMMGFARLARRQAVPSPADAHLDRIVESGERAVAMIDAMLHHAGSVSAAPKLRMVPLADVVGAAIADLDDEVLELDAELEVDTPHAVRSDPTLLRVVVQNLLANALRYHASGTRPHVRVRSVRPSGSVAPAVLLVVEDAGVGIAAADRARVFELGQRLQEVDRPGTGLGLATVRTLVHRLDGEVRIDDSELGGTAVTVTLPPAVGTDRPATAVVAPVEASPPTAFMARRPLAGQVPQGDPT